LNSARSRRFTKSIRVQAKNALVELEAEILNITDQLKTLNNKHKENIKTEEELQATADELTKRLTTADKLITGLDSEKIRFVSNSTYSCLIWKTSNRWKELLVLLQEEKSKLMGNCLLSSAFFNFLGPFTYEYRCNILYKDWLNDIQQRSIPIFLPFTIESNLTSDVEMSKYENY
jgi:dynein heavy chain, axonemal